MQVTVRVPAKINIALRVGPPRADGFHDLATLFHAVSMYDELTVCDDDSVRQADGDAGASLRGANGYQALGASSPAIPHEVTLELEGPYSSGVPADGSNLAVRAVRALAEEAGVPGRAALRVRKGIPVAGGLAGGSADAAGALLACNTLWGLGWPVERLSQVAAALGSDVPFSVVGGTALGTGRGERLEPVRAERELHWVLAVADGELSTPAVYRRLDELRGQPGPSARSSSAVEPPAMDPRLVAAVERGDAQAVGSLMVNDMQAAALDLRPGLSETLAAGRDAGALGGIVSGSGPTCVFLARNGTHAAAVVQALTASGTCRTAQAVVGPV
ncbi:4-(cytidine 5'-diphospho)-2-C-methyl-D-erythritol kinase, partial [Phytoactinopolyspora endophytica]|uniref:4-(cytidine 5'-diphospho)-2-C-methyl-D-erythritol kinase n=1 Tax=Phytoactinopolyspora endophytica TaxID=1642495 RepID=UPI00101DBD2A